MLAVSTIDQRVKNARNLVVNARLSTKTDIVVWLDLINNSISSHESNNERPSSVQELTNDLTTNKNKFKVHVFFQ